MRRGYLGWFESGQDSQWWKDWMCQGGDSTVKWAAEKQPTGYAQLKKISGMTVWGQLLAMLWRTTRMHQVILQHSYSAYKRQSCNWPLGLKGPKLRKWGKPDVSAGTKGWKAFPPSIPGLVPTRLSTQVIGFLEISAVTLEVALEMQLPFRPAALLTPG